MNGFFLYSLLLDRAERGNILTVQHDRASQKDRLDAALDERNKAIEGIGQECWPHACNLCFIVFEDDEGRLSECCLLTDKTSKILDLLLSSACSEDAGSSL